MFRSRSVRVIALVLVGLFLLDRGAVLALHSLNNLSIGNAFEAEQTPTPTPTPKPTPPPGQVLTWNCEEPVKRPKAIVLTCADAGIYVDNIKWETWSYKGATGTGIFHANDCDPDCADGTMHEVPVTLSLTELDEYKWHYYLRQFHIESSDGNALPTLSTPTYDWDVMEFLEIIIN